MIRDANQTRNVLRLRLAVVVTVLIHVLMDRLVLALPNVWPNSTELCAPVLKAPRVTHSEIAINHVSCNRIVVHLLVVTK